jgi:broad specificity phosphatase PhoE
LKYLLLVRHSQPEIVEGIPAKAWRLSDEGRRRCESMAKIVASYAPQAVVTSREPKAMETGQIIAKELNLPVSDAKNLHEHERDKVPFLDRDEFVSVVKRFFDYPHQLILGDETADQASARFDAAVQSVLANNTESVAIVAHGTVMSLFAAKHTNIDVHSLWKRLGMPAMLVFSVPEMELMEIIEGVAE